MALNAPSAAAWMRAVVGSSNGAGQKYSVLPARVLVLVIIHAGLRAHLDHRQRAGRPGCPRWFPGRRFFPPSAPGNRSASLRPAPCVQSETRSTNCRSDAGALPDRLEHHRRVPAHRPAGAGESITMNRAVGTPAATQRCLVRNFVERDPARFGVAAGVRHAQFFEPALHRAVFAVGAVQRQEDHVGFRSGRCHFGVSRVHFVNRVAERAQGLARRRRRTAAKLRARRSGRPASR